MKNQTETIRRVTNIDDVVQTFKTDQDFLEFGKNIYKENELDYATPDDIEYNKSIGLYMPETAQQAEKYIKEYCGGLVLQVLPEAVQTILDKYSTGENDYENCANMAIELEAVGYTCDYGLDAEPHNLRKL